MPKYVKHMSPEESSEWIDALDDALNGSKQADQAAIDRAEAILADAKRAGRQWPYLLERQWSREGMRAALKARSKEQSRALIDYNGRLVSKDLRRGVVRMDDAGREVFQQVLFAEMTWDEFDRWRRYNRDSIEALRINEHMAQKIDALRALVPDTATIQEACDRLGTTLEAVLAS